MAIAGITSGKYVPLLQNGNGAQTTAIIASTLPGVNYAAQSSLPIGTRRLQPLGYLDARSAAAQYAAGSMVINGRTFGKIGYLDNPYNDYPYLNDPYNYPYGVSAHTRAYFRGSPGECAAPYYPQNCVGCGSGCNIYNGPNYYR